MGILTKYAAELDSCIGMPGAIADIGVRISAEYARYTEELIQLEINQALFFDSEKFAGEKPLSDQAVNSKYLKTLEGQRYNELKKTLKALEKLLGSCKTHTFVANQESKAMY
jgi:hypothetical protein